MQPKLLLILILTPMLLWQTGCVWLPTTAPEPLPALPDPAAYVQEALRLPPDAALSGIARISVRAAGSSRSYKTVLACSYPDALRLEVLGLFNQPGLYLSANRKTGITLCIPSENAWYRGPATPETMQRISGIRMDPFDVIQTLLGSPPGLDPAAASSTCVQDGSSYACTLEHGEAVQYLWISPTTGRVIRSILFEHGLPVHDISYQNFAHHNGRYVAETVMVSFERYATSLEIKLQSTRTAALDSARLALEPPPGTVILPIDAFFTAQ